jgi:hypothetical protein
MSNKYLRREVARGCPVHKIVMEEAGRELEQHGFFSKEDVLDSCRMSAMAESIRWDYVKEFLQEDNLTELIPLASSFFKRHSTKSVEVRPEKFLAMGHGKKTAGYACVRAQANEPLVICRLEQRRSLSNGVGKAFALLVENVKKANPKIDYEPTVKLVGNSKD